jgi:hypothetical protein
VVVAWTKASIESRWVQVEADDGIERSSLIPALLEDVKPPLGFGGLHATDLVGWSGASEAPAFQMLVGAIRKKIGGCGDVGVEPQLLVIVVGSKTVQRIKAELADQTSA